MAYFKLQLLTPIYSTNASKKYVVKFLSSTISEFYSQKEANDYNKQFNEAFATGVNTEKIETPVQKRSYCFTFDEKLEIHNNASKTLTFSMLKNILINDQYINNPFFSTIHNGTILLLTDKYDNEFLFTVKNIAVNITDINMQYNITCEDSFSYQLTRQNDGYTIENDAEKEDFIGARNIDSWIVNYIISDCHISYRYLTLEEGLFLDKNGYTHIFTDITKKDSNIEVKKILKQPYPKDKYEEYYTSFVFSVSDSNALNALISVGEKINFNIKTCEHHNKNENEYDLYFWVEPTKKEEVSGLVYSPYTDIQSFDFSHNGESLTTVLNVQSNELSGDRINSLFPEIPTFFTQLFQDEDLWNKNINYFNGMFSSLCQHMLISSVNGVSEKALSNRYSVKINDCFFGKTDILTQASSTVISNLKSFIIEDDGIYIPLLHQDGTKFTLPFLYSYVDFYFNDKNTQFTLLQDSQQDIYSNKNKRFLLKIFYYNETLSSYSSLNFGYQEIPSDLLKNNSLYYVYFYIPYAIKKADLNGFISINNINLYLDFKRNAKEDLEFAQIADACPWLENKIINLNYFQTNKLISKYDYQQLMKILLDDLRIVNGKLMIYSNEYYNSLHKKTQLIAQIVNNLDSLGAAFNADVVDTYGRTGSISDIDRFNAAYNNVFVNINSQSKGWLSRDEDLTNYGNKYFNAQQRFLKNMYNFRRYWETPASFSNNQQVYTDILSIAQKDAEYLDTETNLFHRYGFIDSEWTNATSFDNFILKDENENSLVSLYKDTNNKTEISNIVSKNNYYKYYINLTDNTSYIEKDSSAATYDKDIIYYDIYFNDLLNTNYYTITKTEETIDATLLSLFNNNTILILKYNDKNNSLWKLYQYTKDSQINYCLKMISNSIDEKWKNPPDENSPEEYTYTLAFYDSDNNKIIECNTATKKYDFFAKEKVTKEEMSARYLLNMYASSSNFEELPSTFEYHTFDTYKKTADNLWWMGYIDYNNNKYFIDEDQLFFYFSTVSLQWYNIKAKSLSTEVGLEVQNFFNTTTFSVKNLENNTYYVWEDYIINESYEWPIIGQILPMEAFNYLAEDNLQFALLAFDLYRDSFPLNNIYYKGYSIIEKDGNYYFTNNGKNTYDIKENFKKEDYLNYWTITCTTPETEVSKYRRVEYANEYKFTYSNLINKYSIQTSGQCNAIWDGTNFRDINGIVYSEPYRDEKNKDSYRTINGYADLIYMNKNNSSETEKNFLIQNNDTKDHIYFIYSKTAQAYSNYNQYKNIEVITYEKIADQTDYIINKKKGMEYTGYYSLFSQVCPTYSNLVFSDYISQDLGYYYKDSYIQLLTKDSWINKNEKYRIWLTDWDYQYTVQSQTSNKKKSAINKLFAKDYTTIDWKEYEETYKAKKLKNYKWQIVNGRFSKVTHYDLLNSMTISNPFDTNVSLQLKDCRFSIDNDLQETSTKLNYKIYSAEELGNSELMKYFYNPFCSYWIERVKSNPEDYKTIGGKGLRAYPRYGVLDDPLWGVEGDQYWNPIYEIEWKENLEEFKKYLFYIIIDGEKKFFFVGKDEDYEIDNNITPIAVKTLDGTFYYWNTDFNINNWFDTQQGTIADFSTLKNFAAGYFYIPDLIENYTIATEFIQDGIYYYNNNGYMERVYTLKELLDDKPFGQIKYLSGSTYISTTLNNNTSSWTLPIVHTTYNCLTYKNRLKLNITNKNSNNTTIILNTTWTDSENNQWILNSYQENGENGEEKEAIITLVNYNNTNYELGNEIQLNHNGQSLTGSVIEIQETKAIGDLTSSEEINLTIDVDAELKNIGINKYYDKNTWEELDTSSKQSLNIYILGQPQGEVLSKLTNGQFWLKYHTYNDSNENLAVLFEHAAMIETELQSYWSSAYTASQYCEYFIPESWQDYLDTTYNYFQKSIYSESGILLTDYIPIVNIYNPNNEYKNGEMQKYILRYDTTDQTVKSINKNTPMSYNANKHITISAASDVLGNNEVFLNQLKILNSSIYDWTAEKVDGATITYYYATNGGTTWQELLSNMDINSNGYDYFNGLYIMTFRIINEQYFNRTSTLYNYYLQMHDNLWQEIYTQFPGVILEDSYSNEDATTSTELYESAYYYFKDLSEPERAYNITVIDINTLKGYNGQELDIGIPIAINAEEYYDEHDDIKTTLNQYLFITDINYTLRNDSDISLVVNNIKYQDKLIKRLVNLIK